MPGGVAPLHGGGSISLAAPHFCPVCGIIATSAANLQVRSPTQCQVMGSKVSLEQNLDHGIEFEQCAEASFIAAIMQAS